MSKREMKIGIIGDKDTVTGFLLTGIGQRESAEKSNYLVVDENTPGSEIENKFAGFLDDRSVGIIIVNQKLADNHLRHLISAHEEIIPTILEIPSKDCPYQIENDMVVQKVCKRLNVNPEK